MPGLDLFQSSFEEDQRRAMRETAPALPVPFDQAFEAAWRSGRLFSQSTAQTNTNALVFDEALDEVRQRTGVNAAAKINYDDPTRDPWQQLNDQIGEIKATRPDLGVAVSPYDDAEVRRRMVDKSRGALDDLAEAQGREQTFGGKIGAMLGGLAASTADPLNLVAAPVVAPAGLGVLGSALAWGAISGATALASEAVGAGYREEVQPGYGAGAPGRVGEAALLGAVTGGGLHALANVWSRVKTGAWPRSVRDAGNIVESEAQIADSARPPMMGTAEGDRVHTELPLSAEGAVADEVAHREALSTAVDQVLRGDPVDVGIDVYHGSPHQFDRFDIGKIGTGEGAQSFGHGLYFAETPEVAEAYRRNLAPQNENEALAMQLAENLGRTWSDLSKAEQIDLIEKVDADPTLSAQLGGQAARKGLGGALYRVRINADPEHFVDYDKPLSEQAPRIQEAFRAAIDELGKDPWYPQAKREEVYDPSKSAGEIIDAMRMEARARGKETVLEDALKSRGIPGIKYLDQGSRAGGEGTRNYVVFDDNLLDITHVNGEPVPVQERPPWFVKNPVKSAADIPRPDTACAAGWCYPTAAKMAMRHDINYVIGSVNGPEGKRIYHGWAETKDGRFVYDGTYDRWFDAPLYYEATGAKVHHRDEVTGVERIDINRGTIPGSKYMGLPSDPAEAPIIESAAKPTPTPKPTGPEPLPTAAAAEMRPEAQAETIASPQMTQALAADLERLTIGEKPTLVPVGVDRDGNEIMASLDSLLHDAQMDADAASELEACAMPQPEEEAAE